MLNDFLLSWLHRVTLKRRFAYALYNLTIRYVHSVSRQTSSSSGTSAIARGPELFLIISDDVSMPYTISATFYTCLAHIFNVVIKEVFEGSGLG